MKDTTLIILAAGLGSRFGGNKQISHVGPHGEILMEYSIHDAIEAGFTQVVFILKKEMVDTVRESIGKKIEGRVRVDYAVQDTSSLPAWYKVPEERTKPFGTVHAVLCAKDMIQGPFATVNADDYYGKEAFKIMYEMLNGFRGKQDASMVPYILGNTMSENGGVTRGICDVKRGYLQSIDETHDIHYEEDHRIVGEFGGLDPQEMVSMNLWGFHTELLPVMDTYFEDFLRALKPEDIKAECLLPVMVNDFMKNETVAVRAKSSPDRWFGITYQADRDTVAAELQLLHKKGVYPERLF